MTDWTALDPKPKDFFLRWFAEYRDIQIPNGPKLSEVEAVNEARDLTMAYMMNEGIPEAEAAEVTRKWVEGQFPSQEGGTMIEWVPRDGEEHEHDE